MNDPDGIMFLLLFGLGGIAALLIALVVETTLARGMRRRARREHALRRYTDSIGSKP